MPATTKKTAKGKKRGPALTIEQRTAMDHEVEVILLTGGGLTEKRAADIGARYGVTSRTVWNSKLRVTKVKGRELAKLKPEAQFADFLARLQAAQALALRKDKFAACKGMMALEARLLGFMQPQVMEHRVSGQIGATVQHNHDHKHSFSAEDFADLTLDRIHEIQEELNRGAPPPLTIDAPEGSVVDKPNGGNGSGRPLLELPDEDEDET